jgi:Na+-translocating ferredoxin:NAD+ oxidoreductase RnfC subunit
MNRDLIILKADATYDLKIKAGDKVRKGEKIGLEPGKTEPLISPISGTVNKLVFNSSEHCFEIHIDGQPPMKQ